MNVSNNTVQIDASDNGEVFVLPECFFTLASDITVFVARNLIISGSSSSGSQADPLLRLSSALTRLDLQTVALVNPSSTSSGSSYSYTPNWDALFASKSALQELSLVHVGLAGSLPSYLPPTVSSFVLNQNVLTGALPSGLLANATSASEFVLSLAGNQLSGSISSNFVALLKQNVDNFYLDLSSNLLSGTIPESLLSNVSLSNATTVSIFLNNNQLQGTIASNFLGDSLTAVDTLQVNLSSNSLTGTLSPFFFAHTGSLRRVSLDLSANGFSGSVPTFLDGFASPALLTDASFILSHNGFSGSLSSALGANATFTALTSLEWKLDSNSISGTVPSTLIDASAASLTDLSISLQNNALTGTLPTSLFVSSSNQISVLFLSLASNRLSGPISSGFLANVPAGLNDLTLDLSSNAFAGSIPTSFLKPYTNDSQALFRTLSLNLANCSLTGSIPANLTGGVVAMTIVLDNNQLTGSYSFSDLVAEGSAKPTATLTLSAVNNQLTGEVRLPNASSSFELLLNLSRNSLSSLVIDTGVVYVASLDLSNNTALTGSLPAVLFSAEATLEVLKASHTNLSGVFPSADSTTNSTLEVIDLSYTAINFCDSSRAAWTSSTLTSCLLVNTNATSCASTYPSICDTTATPSSPAAVPTGVPTAVPTAGPVRPPTSAASLVVPSQWLLAALLVLFSAAQLC